MGGIGQSRGCSQLHEGWQNSLDILAIWVTPGLDREQRWVGMRHVGIILNIMQFYFLSVLLGAGQPVMVLLCLRSLLHDAPFG